MYRISEFSNMVGLPQSKIRFYERYGLFDVKRDEKGHRYYLPEDAFRVNAFRHLLRFGFTIEKAIQMLDEKQESHEYRNSLSLQKDELKRQRDLLDFRIEHIDSVLKFLKDGYPEEFELTYSEDYLYTFASQGRDFSISTQNEKAISQFVELLTISYYARIIKKSDFDNECAYVDPSYVCAIPLSEAYRLGKYDKNQVKCLMLGRCIRFHRRKTRAESVRKESFDGMFTYLKNHGYQIRGDIILFPSFLNLDGAGSDIETLVVPIE